MNKDYQPAVFSLDYERSLRASFSAEEFRKLAEEIFVTDNVSVFSTYLIQY